MPLLLYGRLEQYAIDYGLKSFILKSFIFGLRCLCYVCSEVTMRPSPGRALQRRPRRQGRARRGWASRGRRSRSDGAASYVYISFCGYLSQITKYTTFCTQLYSRSLSGSTAAGGEGRPALRDHPRDAELAGAPG